MDMLQTCAGLLRDAEDLVGLHRRDAGLAVVMDVGLQLPEAVEGLLGERRDGGAEL